MYVHIFIKMQIIYCYLSFQIIKKLCILSSIIKNALYRLIIKSKQKLRSISFSELINIKRHSSCEKLLLITQNKTRNSDLYKTKPTNLIKITLKTFWIKLSMAENYTPL